MIEPTSPLSSPSGANEAPADAPARVALRILVRGQVQGVGFRPFVYRLARQISLCGSVRNTHEGAVIELEGRPDDIAQFQDRITAEAPGTSTIDEMLAERMPPSGYLSFTIEASDRTAGLQVRIPRDLAICDHCRNEIIATADRRRNYPFTNCTACGPRYSIIETMPYDRHATAMRRFFMCTSCDKEYHAPTDRRFHAQPNACHSCGPQVALWDRRKQLIAGSESAIGAAATLLRDGQIIALKGIGGFQFLVRADQSDPIRRLRQRKNRPSKPLAVMVGSLDAAEKFAELAHAERQLLESPQNPIVLAKSRSGADVDALAPRIGTVGLMLPTTPLHHLLLVDVGVPVVATSGNQSDEPIAIDECEAIVRLGGIADAFLVHDRPVVRAIDDSVVRVIGGQPVTFRLARGYAPLPLPGPGMACSPPVLAAGGHQKSAQAFWSGTQAILGRHIGDLDGWQARAAFDAEASDLARLYDFEPSTIACDLHPDYFATRWALSKHKPVVTVQHHHAHAAACMAEHGLLNRELLALTWDGTGYGPDGTIWGGECLRVRCDRFDRVASLLPFPLPGGETAVRHPNRAAFGLLYRLLGEEVLLRDPRWTRYLGLPQSDARMLASMIRRRVNTPWTSSVGRLFDAVAAILLGVREVTYEGEAAVMLEAVADARVTDAYELPIRTSEDDRLSAGASCCALGDWRPLLSALLTDLDRDTDVGVVASRFHNSLARWAHDLVARQPHLDVILSGGCFQNKLLTERTLHELGKLNRSIYLPRQVPIGDGGLAAGQLAVALAVNRRDRS